MNRRHLVLAAAALVLPLQPRHTWTHPVIWTYGGSTRRLQGDEVSLHLGPAAEAWAERDIAAIVREYRTTYPTVRVDRIERLPAPNGHSGTIRLHLSAPHPRPPAIVVRG